MNVYDNIEYMVGINNKHQEEAIRLLSLKNLSIEKFSESIHSIKSLEDFNDFKKLMERNN